MLDKSERSKVLSLVLHCSDISHPAKPWELHSKWTPLLMEEFFRQGDQEKELKRQCSPLCDRNTTLVPESQIGMHKLFSKLRYINVKIPIQDLLMLL